MGWDDPNSDPLSDVHAVATKIAEDTIRPNVKAAFDQIASITEAFAAAYSERLRVVVREVAERFQQIGVMLRLRPCKRCLRPIWDEAPQIDEGWCGPCERIMYRRVVVGLFAAIVVVSALAIVLGN